MPDFDVHGAKLQQGADDVVHAGGNVHLGHFDDGVLQQVALQVVRFFSQRIIGDCGLAAAASFLREHVACARAESAVIIHVVDVVDAKQLGDEPGGLQQQAGVASAVGSDMLHRKFGGSGGNQ